MYPTCSDFIVLTFFLPSSCGVEEGRGTYVGRVSIRRLSGSDCISHPVIEEESRHLGPAQWISIVYLFELSVSVMFSSLSGRRDLFCFNYPSAPPQTLLQFSHRLARGSLPLSFQKVVVSSVPRLFAVPR